MSVLVPVQFPTLSAVFMAAAASVLLLFVARMLFLLMRLWTCPASPENEDKENPSHLAFFPNPWRRSLQWNTLPVSLPFALTLPETSSSDVRNAVGVGLAQKRAQMLPVVNWRLRTVPQFQPPPPALYENPVPLSMAKIIMSRHTFRKPNPNRPRRPSAASASRATAPPQTPSRLYHSIA